MKVIAARPQVIAVAPRNPAANSSANQVTSAMMVANKPSRGIPTMATRASAVRLNKVITSFVDVTGAVLSACVCDAFMKSSFGW